MNTNEISVSIVGVLLGYWIIGALVGGKPPPPSQASKSASDDSDRPTSEDNQGNQSDKASATWYEVLEVSSGANLEEVQAAYRSLISQYHPDKVASLGADLRDLAERKSNAINKAYNDALVSIGNR
jgi:DnaJ like chaperone protein